MRIGPRDTDDDENTDAESDSITRFEESLRDALEGDFAEKLGHGNDDD